jgi:hypothetical protein
VFDANCDLRALLRTFPSLADAGTSNVVCAREMLEKMGRDRDLSKMVFTRRDGRRV